MLCIRGLLYQHLPLVYPHLNLQFNSFNLQIVLIDFFVEAMKRKLINNNHSSTTLLLQDGMQHHLITVKVRESTHISSIENLEEILDIPIMTIKTTFQNINTIATQHVASLYFYTNEDLKITNSSPIYKIPHTILQKMVVVENQFNLCSKHKLSQLLR